MCVKLIPIIIVAVYIIKAFENKGLRITITIIFPNTDKTEHIWKILRDFNNLKELRQIFIIGGVFYAISGTSKTC